MSSDDRRDDLDRKAQAAMREALSRLQASVNGRTS
jgi:hypothetical protein